MRCWAMAIPIVLSQVYGCAPLMQSLPSSGGPLTDPPSSQGGWPWLIVVILFMLAAFVGGIGVALSLRRHLLTTALKLRKGQAAPKELEKLQIALDNIEDVMAAMRGPKDNGPRNKGG